MEFTDERIEFLYRFLDKIFDGMGECLYISDCDTGMTDLMTSLEHQTIVDYSEIKDGEFEGIKFDSFFGCTKAVFLFEGWDVVIKIPYNGSYSFDLDTDEVILAEFPNHIAVEDEIYENASYEMKKILLKNNYLFNYDNLEVYAQTAIATLGSKRERECSLLTAELLDKVKTIRDSKFSGYKLPFNSFLAAVMLQYPATYESLFDELLNIEDLHGDNYGYLENGMVAIHDYGGYSMNSPF